MNQTYIVYADVMLLWSLLLNIAGINLATYLLTLKLTLKTRLIASCVTAVLDVIIFVLTAGSPIPYLILYSVLHILVLVLFCRIRDAQTLIIIFLLSFFCAGTIFYIEEKSGSKRFLYRASSLLIAFLLVYFLFGFMKGKREINRNIHPVTISFGDKMIKLNAYYDTGNMLYDAFSKHPVIILNADLLFGIFGNAFTACLSQYEQSGYFDYDEAYKTTGISFHPISYKTISSQTDIMPAFALSSVTFDESSISYEGVTAGICRYRLTTDNSYTVLLHQKLKPIREENSND